MDHRSGRPGARPAAGPGGQPHQGRRDGWLQARPRDWLAQVGTAALDPRRGYASALVAPLGHATVVGTTSTPSRLANAVADQARRQASRSPSVIGARTYGPLYRIRKLLVTAAEQLTERGRARLRARDTMKIERAPTGRRISTAPGGLCRGGSVTVPNRGSMRTRSSPATSKVRNPPGSSAGCYRRDWCRDRRPLGATPDMRGMERCHRRCT
jgi:hypothetical protein